MSDIRTQIVCPWCGEQHVGVCRRVRTADFYPDGTVRRVTFHPPWTPPPRGEEGCARSGDFDLGADELARWGLKPTHGRDLDLIALLGEVGPALRGDVLALLAQKWQVALTASSLTRCLRRVREAGLVEGDYVRRPGGGFFKGHLLLWLSQKGAALYRQLTGNAPAQPEEPLEPPHDGAQGAPVPL